MSDFSPKQSLSRHYKPSKKLTLINSGSRGYFREVGYFTIVFRQIIADLCYGRYIVDGCSLLGVLSLVSHTVDIWLPSMNETIIKNFTDEIEKIGAYYEE